MAPIFLWEGLCHYSKPISAARPVFCLLPSFFCFASSGSLDVGHDQGERATQVDVFEPFIVSLDFISLSGLGLWVLVSTSARCRKRESGR